MFPQFLLGVSHNESNPCPCEEPQEHMHDEFVRKESPEMFALTRNRFPQEPPTGKRLEMIKAQMLRVHRAAGHPSMSNLQKLLRVRKAPE